MGIDEQCEYCHPLHYVCSIDTQPTGPHYACCAYICPYPDKNCDLRPYP